MWRMLRTVSMHKSTLRKRILKGGYFWTLEEFSQVRRCSESLEAFTKRTLNAWVWLSPRPWPRGSTQFISNITLTSLRQSPVKSELWATTSRLSFKTMMTRVSRWRLLEEMDENKSELHAVWIRWHGYPLSLRWTLQSLNLFSFFFYRHFNYPTCIISAPCSARSVSKATRM